MATIELTDIIERAALDVALENGVLRGAAVLRRSGKSGSRTYTDRALSDVVEAINRESIKVYIDHAGRLIAGVRSVADLAGSLRNARLDGNVVRADFAVLPKFRKTVEAMARDGIGGLSIHASAGPIRRDRNRETVESIEKLHSVDLVSETGSTISLLEAKPRHTPNDIIAMVRQKKLNFIDAIKLFVADQWVTPPADADIWRQLLAAFEVIIARDHHLNFDSPPILMSADPPDKSGETITDTDFARALDRAGIYAGELPPELERKLTRTEAALVAAFARRDGLEIK